MIHSKKNKCSSISFLPIINIMIIILRYNTKHGRNLRKIEQMRDSVAFN